MAATASGVARAVSGRRRTWRIGRRAAAILDSPSIQTPSTNSAASVTISGVAGSTRPRTARISAARVTAPAKLPSSCVRAVSIRLPRLWPATSPSPSNRNPNRAATGLVVADRASRELRTSPGARPYGCRRRPELPPSSLVVMIAVIRSRSSAGRPGAVAENSASFNPRRSTGTPVPPPRATIRGARDAGSGCRCRTASRPAALALDSVLIARSLRRRGWPRGRCPRAARRPRPTARCPAYAPARARRRRGGAPRGCGCDRRGRPCAPRPAAR